MTNDRIKPKYTNRYPENMVLSQKAKHSRVHIQTKSIQKGQDYTSTHASGNVQYLFVRTIIHSPKNYKNKKS